jgi:hypothetical protein
MCATRAWLISAADPAAANRAMFVKRLTALRRLHVRSWARFSLSYLGRLHIAKQVLASSLYFHAFLHGCRLRVSSIR